MYLQLKRCHKKGNKDSEIDPFCSATIEVGHKFWNFPAAGSKILQARQELHACART